MKGLRFIAGFVAGAVIAGGVACADEDIRVYVNGLRLNEHVILSNDRTYVPLRAVSESLGADVEWDEASNSVFVNFTEDDAISKVVEQVSPSVVTLIGNYAGSGQAASYNNPTAHGSGVVYKSSGYIITNAHVVEDIKNLTAVLNDGSSYPAKVLYSDEKSDLAIVKIDKLGLFPITIADESTILSGKTAIAVGTPISLTMRNTVTKGIVCGKDVSIPDSYYKLIQTDTAINPGNSGGPLINTKGELIGINTSKYVSLGIDSVAFAIPADTVKYVISQYETYGYVNRPSLDLSLEPSWEAKIGLPTSKGITVKSSSVSQISPGDTITAVGGIPVHSVVDFNEAVKDTYNGETLSVTLTRGGNPFTITLNP